MGHRENGALVPEDGPEAALQRQGRLPPDSRAHLGLQLRTLYAALVSEEPPRLRALMDRLAAALDAREEARSPDRPDGFRQDLIAAIPALRGFALSLAGSPTRADDLVQETVLKAWVARERFEPGTNLLAWLFTILRNQFYSEVRKYRREVEDADGASAAGLVALPDQMDRIELQNVWTRMAALPATQREALLLVGAQGLTYEAAAEVIGCQVGTVKSRVSRARTSLADALGFAEGRHGRVGA